MFLTGFTDEAGSDFAVQLKALKELGWKNMETRAIGSKNLASLTDAEFEDVCAQLDEAGVQINCFGSGIANWSKSALSEEDVLASKKELLDAIPRMHKLKIPMVRGMSYKILTDREPDAPEVEAAVIKNLTELVKICEDNGIIYAHENCMNYGGLSYRHTLKLLDKIQSPNFTLVFDTGNPVFNYRRIGQPPYPLQSSWEFYKQVREFISYVHIKDGTAMPGEDMKTNPPCQYCYPGDGSGDVRAIVIDLRKTGYDGGFSMEPHVANVFHNANPETVLDEVKYTSFVRYGQLFEKLLRECGWVF
ncbi:MAG: sugar phosphate isomerase/epimerase [Lentisphaeria bacterium]|nr:sugar phosphate isomerase/epimerase [Lentisphaeria bacterium]